MTVDALQPGDGRGRSVVVVGRTYAQVWAAAEQAMGRGMEIVERHRPSGVIKSRGVDGTTAPVVALFVRPTDATAPRYTVTVASRRRLHAAAVDRDWEPAVLDDLLRALGDAR